jgi:predicted dehydrogenase
VAEAAARYGFERFETDWRALVADPRIELFDNLAPNNLHAEPTIAAAEAGKHVICEKPLGRTADESLEIWRRVAATGVKHLCAFNYRFVPAVRLAREMLEAGELGEIHHFRGAYLQDWIADPQAPVSWRLVGDEAGSGALGTSARTSSTSPATSWGRSPRSAPSPRRSCATGPAAR